MTAKSKRLLAIVCIASLLGIAAMLVLGALRNNIVFFYAPSEISQTDRQLGQQLRPQLLPELSVCLTDFRRRVEKDDIIAQCPKHQHSGDTQQRCNAHNSKQSF